MPKHELIGAIGMLKVQTDIGIAMAKDLKDITFLPGAVVQDSRGTMYLVQKDGSLRRLTRKKGHKHGSPT